MGIRVPLLLDRRKLPVDCAPISVIRGLRAARGIRRSGEEQGAPRAGRLAHLADDGVRSLGVQPYCPEMTAQKMKGWVRPLSRPNI